VVPADKVRIHRRVGEGKGRRGVGEQHRLEAPVKHEALPQSLQAAGRQRALAAVCAGGRALGSVLAGAGCNQRLLWPAAGGFCTGRTAGGVAPGTAHATASGVVPPIVLRGPAGVFIVVIRFPVVQLVDKHMQAGRPVRYGRGRGGGCIPVFRRRPAPLAGRVGAGRLARVGRRQLALVCRQKKQHKRTNRLGRKCQKKHACISGRHFWAGDTLSH
jgi:hypothetical protein